MTFSRRVAFATGLLVALAAGPATAQRTAQDIASARQLYNEGIALRDKGDLKGALEKFRAAHALGNTPLTGIELCRTHAALRQPVEAREVCLAVGRIPPLAEESARSKDARNDAARLAEAEKPKIGALRLRITGVPVGYEPSVTVDGAPVPAAALAEPRAVNPGQHAVVARVAQGPESRAIVETQEGETKDVDLALQPPPAGAPPPAMVSPQPAPAPPASEKKSNTLGLAAFGVAGATGLVGAVAGIVAISKQGDLSSKCAAKICGRSDWDDLQSAKTWGSVSTGFFVVAGVAAGVGLIATFMKPSSGSAKANVTPVIGVGGAGLHGSF